MDEIAVSLKTKQQALKCYLPFVSHGALLINCEQPLKLGEKVHLMVSFTELKKKLSCDAKLVWISAKDLKGSNNFGVQFTGENAGLLNQYLKKYLAELLDD